MSKHKIIITAPNKNTKRAPLSELLSISGSLTGHILIAAALIRFKSRPPRACPATRAPIYLGGMRPVI